MPDGTPDGSAFGYPVTMSRPEGPDPLSDDVAGPEQQPEASGEPQEPQRPYEPEPQPTEPEAQQQPEEGQQLYAGRYQSVEDLEKGYKEAQGQFTRQQQEIARQNQELLALRGQQAQTNQLLQELVPYFQGQVAEADPEAAERMKLLQEMQPIIQQQVAPLQQQLAAQQAETAAVQVISSFRQRHPDVVAGSQQDYEVAQIVEQLDLVTTDGDALDIAYEAWTDPALRRVLVAQPQLVDTDEGMAYARLQARQMFGPQPTPTANGAPAAPAQQLSAPPQTAFVETGGPGAPAPAASNQARGDEFDEAFDAWAAEKKSPLFGGLTQGIR